MVLSALVGFTNPHPCLCTAGRWGQNPGVAVAHRFWLRCVALRCVVCVSHVSNAREERPPALGAGGGTKDLAVVEDRRDERLLVVRVADRVVPAEKGLVKGGSLVEGNSTVSAFGAGHCAVSLGWLVASDGCGCCCFVDRNCERRNVDCLLGVRKQKQALCRVVFLVVRLACCSRVFLPANKKNFAFDELQRQEARNNIDRES